MSKEELEQQTFQRLKEMSNLFDQYSWIMIIGLIVAGLIIFYVFTPMYVYYLSGKTKYIWWAKKYNPLKQKG